MFFFFILERKVSKVYISTRHNNTYFLTLPHLLASDYRSYSNGTRRLDYNFHSLPYQFHRRDYLFFSNPYDVLDVFLNNRKIHISQCRSQSIRNGIC